MKYLIQFMAMFSDILIVLAAIVLFYSMVKIGNPLFGLIGILLLLMTYRTWKDQGGFIAWTKVGRKSFFDNYDKLMKRGD